MSIKRFGDTTPRRSLQDVDFLMRQFGGSGEGCVAFLRVGQGDHPLVETPALPADRRQGSIEPDGEARPNEGSESSETSTG